jgi:acid phosphatase (class A)
MRLLHRSLLACGVLWATSAHAALLDPALFDATRLLPPPPASGSPKAVGELAEVKAIAARTTPEMLAAATHDAKDETPDIFNPVIGFDIAKAPAAAKLLSLVGDEEEDDTKAAKDFFHRDRPWIVDSSIRTCTPVKPGPAANSYPSGHSTRGFSMAVVLAALLPAKSQAIMARAAEYAENRLVCGMHFRSDITAGQQFGTVLALQLMRNAQFQAQMDAARADLKAAHLIP